MDTASGRLTASKPPVQSNRQTPRARGRASIWVAEEGEGRRDAGPRRGPVPAAPECASPGRPAHAARWPIAGEKAPSMAGGKETQWAEGSDSAWRAPLDRRRRRAVRVVSLGLQQEPSRPGMGSRGSGGGDSFRALSRSCVRGCGRVAAWDGPRARQGLCVDEGDWLGGLGQRRCFGI